MENEMNRLKLLAMAMLLAVPVISACGEDPIPPPATGTIMGKVAIEGDGADGVTVTLSSGVTATTANGGTFSFADVEEGTYTVTISNFPEDASFAQTSAPATLSEDGETVHRQLQWLLHPYVGHYGDGNGRKRRAKRC